MQRITNISIPAPCHQAWQDMSLTNGGRHCASCNKTVTDFTVMTDGEIVDYLNKTDNVCGRLYASQLRNINTTLQPANKGWLNKFWLTAALTIALPSVNSLYAHSKQELRVPDKAMPADTADRNFSGKVTDKEKLGIPAVKVKVVGTDITTTTNVNGYFRIEVPFDKDSLELSFVGFKTQFIKLDKAQKKNYSAELQETDCVVMQEVVAGGIIVRYPFYKRWYYAFIRNPIRRLFQ